MPAKKSKQEEEVAQTPPVSMTKPATITELQARSLEEWQVEDELYPTRLVVVGGEDVAVYSVSLPQSILLGLVDPEVADGFIEVKVESVSRGQVIRGKHHFLHTAHIREIVFEKDLPAHREARP